MQPQMKYSYAFFYQHVVPPCTDAEPRLPAWAPLRSHSSVSGGGWTGPAAHRARLGHLHPTRYLSLCLSRLSWVGGISPWALCGQAACRTAHWLGVVPAELYLYKQKNLFSSCSPPVTPKQRCCQPPISPFVLSGGGWAGRGGGGFCLALGQQMPRAQVLAREYRLPQVHPKY